jgi:hypothetical protein
MANPQRFFFFAMLTVNAPCPPVIGGRLGGFFDDDQAIFYLDVSRYFFFILSLQVGDFLWYRMGAAQWCDRLTAYERLLKCWI